MYNGERSLLTLTWDVVSRWGDTPSHEEAESGISEAGFLICGVEVSKVVNKVLCVRAPGVGDIPSEFLKVLDFGGLCKTASTSGTLSLDLQTAVDVDCRVCSSEIWIPLLSFPGKVFSGVLEKSVCRENEVG